MRRSSPASRSAAPRVSANPNLWINAKQPTQTVENGKTTVTIDQTAAQAAVTQPIMNRPILSAPTP
ncbi:hypothetical protein CQW49_09635 [Methylosinus trichosporium OB3b]|uniref:Uncharacterized protein n=1 Tax=Methylosinus trichosporium (strain ATCC 35070 / NCIMB 11131 / UNIQEM 75 / OB3b) TaxID=595536 RepID=A0A2D2CZH4_METT3|nr:hypothetical protein CQW49_09635 [Methylosinus trichosporium OB3b]OBS53502.1 hypothetical protein A8B73_05455 [Methylosinus sp. 3S-1]